MTTTGQLIANLNRIGVHFIAGELDSTSIICLTPSEILAELAKHTDARLRLAIIVVLLQRPEFAQYADETLTRLEETGQITFMLYYTAAHILQKVYSQDLENVLGRIDELPELFSDNLGLDPSKAIPEQLIHLADRHKYLTGLPINWLGTYHHAAQRVIARLKKEQAWEIA